MSERTCLACDRPIEPSRRADAKVCPTPSCRVWSRRHPGEKKPPEGPISYVCQYERCGKTFTRERLRAGKRPRFCSDPCWGSYRHLNRPEGYWRDRDVESTRRASRKYASKNKAYFRAYRLAHRAEEHKRDREYKKRRRAWKFGVAYEALNSYEIYSRDNWVCGICGERVDPQSEYPDPLSASLDHIIPLSKRGSHTRANVQLAHLICNVRKRDRI